jgi:hypothetical protein
MGFTEEKLKMVEKPVRKERHKCSATELLSVEVYELYLENNQRRFVK